MAAKTATARDVAAEVVYLTRALKAPTLRDAVERLAGRAREESWTHEEFLIACLQREVSARESHGSEGRIRAARFPSRKSLEKFDYDHARGLKRDLVAHLGTLDFVTAKDNVLLLGPPGTGKTHLATGLAIRACQAGHRVLFATASLEDDGARVRLLLPRRADLVCDGQRGCQRRPDVVQTDWSMSAAPWPPPPQMPAAPTEPEPRAASRRARCPVMRVPEAPMGCPRAIAPPCVFTIAGSSPSCRVEWTATAAKASLISTAARSAGPHLVWLSASRMELDGWACRLTSGPLTNP